MSYVEIAGLCQGLNDIGGGVLGGSLDENLAGVVRKSSCWDWLKDEVRVRAELYDHFEEARYLRGWLEGVLESWGDIESQL